MNTKNDPTARTEQLAASVMGMPEEDLIDHVLTMPLSARARLAVFFYQRKHLRLAGLRIAGTCDWKSLVEAYGTAGHILYKQSRTGADVEGFEAASKVQTRKAPAISLAGARFTPSADFGPAARPARLLREDD